MPRKGIMQTTLRMKSEIHQRFEATCKSRGEKMSNVLLQAVEGYWKANSSTRHPISLIELSKSIL